MEFRHEFISHFMDQPAGSQVMVGLMLSEFQPDLAQALLSALKDGLNPQELKMIELSVEIVRTGIQMNYGQWLEDQPKKSIGGN